MTTKQLKDLLTDIADEVKPASLYLRAVTRSRHAAMRRAVLASITALMLIGGGVFGLNALVGWPQHDKPVQADAALPSSTVEELAGTYFQTLDHGGDDEVLVSWRADEDTADEVAEPGTTGGRFSETGQVSPDGGSIAYMTQSSGAGGEPEASDRIMVQDLEDGKPNEVARYSEAGELCSSPTWAPDGERLFIDRGSLGDADRRTGFVDADSGEFTPFPVKEPCDLRVATDPEGEDVVFSTAASGDTVEVYATDAGGDRTAMGAAEVAEANGSFISELVAVSPDGRFLCVSSQPGPGTYSDRVDYSHNYCNLVIDTSTEEALPVAGLEESRAIGSPSVFAIPGRLLLEGEDGTGEDTHRLYDYEGKLIDEVDSAMKSESLPLAFVPD